MWCVVERSSRSASVVPRDEEKAADSLDEATPLLSSNNLSDDTNQAVKGINSASDSQKLDAGLVRRQNTTAGMADVAVDELLQYERNHPDKMHHIVSSRS